MIKNKTICSGAVMDIKSRFTVRFRDFLNVEIIVEVVFKSILNIYKSCGKLGYLLQTGFVSAMLEGVLVTRMVRPPKDEI